MARKILYSIIIVLILFIGAVSAYSYYKFSESPKVISEVSGSYFPMPTRTNYSQAYACVYLYSGRENPCWDISTSTVMEITSRVQSAPSNLDWVSNDALGYNGFYVFLPAGNKLISSNNPSGYAGEVIIRISAGKVSYYNWADMVVRSVAPPIDRPDPAVTYKKDVGRKIEEWLLGIAKENIPASDFAAIVESRKAVN